MKGLINIGNTCYMNSALQCLIHIPEIRNFFLIGRHKDYLNSDIPEEQLCLQFEILTYNMCQNRDIKTINPIDFVKTFLMVCSNKNRIFNGFQQNDMGDFLNILLEFLHNSISNSISIRINGVIKTIGDKHAFDAANSWGQFFKKSHSHIIEMLYSQIISTTICPNCKHSCFNYEPSLTIDLSIPNNIHSSSLKLYDLLDSYTKVEVLDTDNQWKCDECKTRVNCMKKIHFWKLSPVLIIIIKKYNLNFKINQSIDYPFILDMTKYCMNYNDSNLKYKLNSVCIHEGGLNGGHYWSMCNKYGTWYKYNDDYITKIDDNDEVKHDDAYCLIYRRYDNKYKI